MSDTTQTYEQLRSMKGRGQPRLPLTLTVGEVVRVDGMKYRVQSTPMLNHTGSVEVEVYSEDNQYDTLFLSNSTVVMVLGAVS